MKAKYSIPLFVILICIGVFFIFSHKNSARTTTQMYQELPKEVVVVLNKDGFSPKNTTITSGTAVRWKNTTDKQQTVNSDNYPTNQLHKELNFGVFNANSSVVFIFKQAGIYGYHNQFHPEQKGTITVIK